MLIVEATNLKIEYTFASYIRARPLRRKLQTFICGKKRYNYSSSRPIRFRSQVHLLHRPSLYIFLVYRIVLAVSSTHCVAPTDTSH